jgi:hypothetical protein
LDHAGNEQAGHLVDLAKRVNEAIYELWHANAAAEGREREAARAALRE